MKEEQKLLPKFASKDEWDEGAEFFTRFVRLQKMKATGFGHWPIGQRIPMSDRTYEIKSNGFMKVRGLDGKLVTVPKPGTYVRVA